MRVLHAYICQEYYDNWAKEQSAECLPVSKDVFLRTFGTPMILFESYGTNELFPILEGGLIRINQNYHIECKNYRNTLPESQPSEILATTIETVLKSPTVTSIRSRIFRWLGM